MDLIVITMAVVVVLVVVANPWGKEGKEQI